MILAIDGLCYSALVFIIHTFQCPLSTRAHRYQCGVPVIIEGETGVGKTALVEMLSKLWNHSQVVLWKKQQKRLLDFMRRNLGDIDTDVSDNYQVCHNSHGKTFTVCGWILHIIPLSLHSSTPSTPSFFSFSLPLRSLILSLFFKYLLLLHVREYKTAGGLSCQTCQNMWSYYVAQDYTLDLGTTKMYN